MAINVYIQPTEQTVVRFVRDLHNPPYLMISDGSAMVWLGPDGGPHGAILAAEFAERLSKTAGAWQEACQALAATASVRPYLTGER